VEVGVALGLVGLSILTPVLLMLITVASWELVPVDTIAMFLPCALVPVLLRIIEADMDRWKCRISWDGYILHSVFKKGVNCDSRCELSASPI
jgi:hypothetical protein